jgi:hypothetical protein
MIRNSKVIIFLQIIQNDNLKKNFEIKFAYVTNDTTETSIKNHVYDYTTPREMVTCDLRLHITPTGAILIFSINCSIFKILNYRGSS